MVFYGSSARHFALPGHEIKKTIFPDGEISVFFDISIENSVIYYFQSTSFPVNDNLIEFLITINAFQQQFADKVIAIMPYFGYARQDRLNNACSSVSAKVIADLVGKSGIHKLITLDLHTHQLTGFFPIPVCHLSIQSLLAKHILQHFDSPSCILVSPDIGGVKRVNDLCVLLSMDMAIIDKKRINAIGGDSGHVIGNIEGKTCLLVDDMIDSGETIMTAAKKLAHLGAKDIHAFATHGLFSGNAIQRLESSIIKTITVSNSIDQRRLLNREKFAVIDVHDFLYSYAVKNKKILSTSIIPGLA